MKKLQDQTDNSLIKNIKRRNCEESLKILIERHSPLCYKIYKKYMSSFNVKNIDLTEIYQQKDFTIYKTILSFDKTKNVKFSTWLGNQIRYQCLNAINKKEDIIYMEPPELQYLIDQNKTETNEKLIELRQYINVLLNQLKDARISRIFNMRYFETNSNPTWTKIGKRMNMSTQNAINLHNKGLQILKNKLTSKDLFDRI